MTRKFIVLLFVIVIATSAMAQKTVRYTYLWDVTLSMSGFGGAPDIFKDVVEVMVNDINSISDERSEIVVIPFQNKAYEAVWREPATVVGKKNIISKIKSYVDTDTTGTNISAPLQYAIDNVFSAERIDIMKLMTDGNDNVNPSRLQHLLSQWCQLAESKDVYGYYILLTKDAQKGNITLQLQQICRFESVNADGNLKAINDIVQETARFADGVSINIRDEYNKPKRLEFVQYMGDKVPVGFKIHFKTRDNPYLTVNEVVEIGADNSVVIDPRFNLPQEDLINTLPTNTPDGSVILDFKPTDGMSTGNFAFTRLIDDHCTIFLVNKPEKTVRIYLKK